MRIEMLAPFMLTCIATVNVERSAMIKSTHGTDAVTWYRDDAGSHVRVHITFPNERREVSGLESLLFGAPEGALEPGLVELFSNGDDSYATLGVRDPESLMELAEALREASLRWRHAIGECSCDEESEEACDSEESSAFGVMSVPGGLAISLGDIPLSGLFGALVGAADEEADEEDAPLTDEE